MIINKKTAPRVSATKLLDILLNYDVISFDIFDTLILRNCTNPYDVYKFLAAKHKRVNFGKVRTEASQKTRSTKPSGEVTIYEIYEEVNKTLHLDVEECVRAEFEFDKQVCTANPYFVPILDALVRCGKEVIIVSDMYYSADMIRELLSCCGIKGFSKLYISCEYNMSKANGDLFEHVASNYDAQTKIVHIGDNYQHDVENSQRVDWDAFYYRKVGSEDTSRLKFTMSYMQRSYYNALIANKFYNGNYAKGFDNVQKYYYGYTYAGILALGYVNWLHQQAQERNIEKILMLSRDCFVLNDIYNNLYKDIPCEYVHWSRYAGLATAPEVDMPYFFFQFLDREIVRSSTVMDFLSSCNMESFQQLFADNGIKPDELLECKETRDKIKDIMLKNMDTVILYSDKYKNAAKAYFQNVIGDANNILVVDIGWRGSSILTLKYLIEKVWGLADNVIGAMVGNYAYRKGYDATLLYTEDILTYVFSERWNADYAKLHQKNTQLNNSIIETFFSSMEPSFLSYIEVDGKVQKQFAQTPGNKSYSEIYRGIMDFSLDYVKNVPFFPELMNISGRDAYAPVLALMKDPKKFSKVFSDVNFDLSVGSIKSKSHTYTIKDIVRYLTN